MSSRAPNPRLVLPVVLAGTFMAILDVSIVVVAIPSIRADLRAGYGAAEFVISAYTLTYASLLVTGGRLGTGSAGGACSSPACSGSPAPQLCAGRRHRSAC